LILVVDDFVESAEVLAEVLSDRGFMVTLAFDGKDAIERALANVPDVIVMDLAMPRLDGLGAARVLKGDPRTRSIPILLYTAHEGLELDTMARAVGVAAVVGKHDPPTALLAAVDDALSGQV
jgi:CheY-like chemotaxis protein